MIPYGKQSIDEDDINLVVDALKSDYLTTGPKVKEFEEELAKKLNFKFVVAVSSGTAALHLSSIVLLNQGDKVITTPNSFLATSNSIIYQKAKPIFVDISDNGLIDLDLVEEKLQKEKIKALYLVSFSGHPLDDEKVKYLKEKYKVKILYDNSHFIGKDNGICDIATYSFHPVKHITTFEGGAIATNDEKIYKKLLMLRNHGIYKDSSYPWEYKMVELGYNYRLSDVACAVGLSQLKKLDYFQNRRHEISKYYHVNLPKNITPLYAYNKNSSYHLFVVRYSFKNFEEKAKFFNEMRKKGIALQYHYIPINSQPFYQKKGYKFSKKEFPKMNRYYLEAFSLPIYPSLTQKEQQYVIENLKKTLKNS
jgi:UDP-4-amino-4,6-dideoxy-L-N-acetyl-beta-L-altrosamine transaminase